MERGPEWKTTDVDSGRVRYAFTGWQLAVVAAAMLLVGFVGAIGGKMYTRHNEQHWNVEQALRQQEQINREFAGAINQLLQRK